MKIKKEFVPPKLLCHVTVQLENGLLAGSAVDMFEIESAGQEVEALDFDSSGAFNFTWEE